jgi:hypothetical protein
MPSIYRPKHSVIAPESDVCAGAHVNTDAHPPHGAITDDQKDWVGRRKGQPANVLLSATRRWLDSLPIEARPEVLAAQFPRLANLIAASWNNPGDCGAFIYSLLHDQRGDRRGFPSDVLKDILNLRMYYVRLHPIVDWVGEEDINSPRQVWEQLHGKR